MSLGRREARHQTSAAAKVAGVEPSADWDFQPGQRVQTVDGLPGRVTAVQDGPVRGAEGYEVTLDDGMGGGLYTSSQLAPAPETVASLQETAAADYPELEEVLAQRPDIARNTVLGSLKTASTCYECFGSGRLATADKGTQDCKRCGGTGEIDHKTAINDAEMSQASSERAQDDPNHACPHCGLGPHDDNGYCENCGSHIDDDEPEGNHDEHDDYYSQGGGHEDNYGDPYGRMDAYHDFKNSSLHETAGWSWADPPKGNPYKLDTGFVPPPPREEDEGAKTAADETGLSDDGDDGFGSEIYCTECGTYHGERRHQDSSPAKDYDGVDTSVGGNTLSNGMTSGDGGSDSGSSNSTTSSLQVEAEWSYGHHEQPMVHVMGQPAQRPLQAGDHVMHPNGEFTDKVIAAAPSLLHFEQSGIMHRGPIEGDHSKSIWSSDSVDEAGKDVPKATPEQTKFLDSNPTGPTKYSALDIFDPFDILVTASTDPDFRFEVTAAWSDVRAKAKRIRTTGGVNVTMVTEGMIFAEIKGDHNVYETGLQKLPGKQSVQGWSCGCKWGAYHWGADDDFSRFAGRMCSHALALQFEAQARGMFGRNVEPDMEKPSWVPRRVVVKYDIDADQNRSARPTYPDYGRVASLSALSALSAYAKAEGMGADDFAVECVLAGVTAAVNSPWGEPQADVPEVSGPTRPPHSTDNPASTGWASAPDPQSWNTAITPDTIGMAASLNCHRTKADYAASEADDTCKECGYPVSDHDGQYSGGEYGESNTYQASLDEFLFEAGGGPTGTGGSMMPAAGPESTLNDEPEAALPQTDGELDLGSGLPLSNGSPSGGSMGAGSPQIKGDPTSLEPESPSIMSTGGVDDIVASFQAKAAHLNPAGGGGQGDGDIAAAAKEFLAKEAVKDFTPGEQATIINEGQGVTAANLDRLDIAGTHYEPLEAALAARDAEEDDEAWMA